MLTKFFHKISIVTIHRENGNCVCVWNGTRTEKNKLPDECKCFISCKVPTAIEVVMLYMEQLQESKSIKPIRLGTGLSQSGNAANTAEMLQAWNL